MHPVMRFLCLVGLVSVLLPATGYAEDKWEYRVTPYIWFAGIKGDVSTLPNAPVAPIDISASDALKDTQTAFMGVFEVRKGKHSAFIDFIYTDVESDETLIGDPINLTLKTVSKNWETSVAYSYRFYKTDRASADAFAGGRYWKVDTYLEFGGGLGLLAGKNTSSSESWLDPLIGIKGTSTIGGSKFYATGVIGGGGFGLGSDYFYDASLYLGYQWSKLIGTALGYRMFDVKYEQDSFYYDVRQQGWLLGVSFAF